MGRNRLIVFGLAASLVLAFLAINTDAANITPQLVAGPPSAFLKVTKEPDPALMGGWQCIWRRELPKVHDWDINPVEFWLVKYENRYALYFYRTKNSGLKKYVGWKDWQANGSEIFSETGVRFFTQGGEVFFQWQNDKPIKMSRIEESR